jgi:cephalosporin hydroxylase
VSRNNAISQSFVIALLCGLLAGAGIGAGAALWWVTHPAYNPVDLDSEKGVIAAFHRIYHNNWWDRTVLDTRWFGAEAMKCPLDMWVFQEIMYETRPDVVVETGTRKGGSSSYFASILDLLGNGRVITVDIVDYPDKPQHDRVTYLTGSSTSQEIIDKIKEFISPGEKVMVFLDSDHSKAHVQKELELYSGLVTPGNYLIVEDTHLNGHPIFTPAVAAGPGPMEAVEEFLSGNPDFVADRSREKFGLTFNPNGFLKRESRP